MLFTVVFTKNKKEVAKNYCIYCRYSMGEKEWINRKEEEKTKKLWKIPLEFRLENRFSEYGGLRTAQSMIDLWEKKNAPKRPVQQGTGNED